MEKAHAVLQDTFGFPSFRHTQEEVRRLAAAHPKYDAMHSMGCRSFGSYSSITRTPSFSFPPEVRYEKLAGTCVVSAFVQAGRVFVTKCLHYA